MSDQNFTSPGIPTPPPTPSKGGAAKVVLIVLIIVVILAALYFVFKKIKRNRVISNMNSGLVIDNQMPVTTAVNSTTTNSVSNVNPSVAVVTATSTPAPIVNPTPAPTPTPTPKPITTGTCPNVVSANLTVGQCATCTCAAGLTSNQRAAVWGTTVYTDDSNICASAVHAGAVSITYGGSVTYTIVGAQNSYLSSTKNGLTSSSYGPWSRSFKFGTGTTAASTPASTPTSAQTPSSATTSSQIYIKLVTPNGGETYKAGDNWLWNGQKIKVTANLPGTPTYIIDYKLELLNTSGVVVVSDTGETINTSWANTDYRNIPSWVPAGQYKLRVTVTPRNTKISYTDTSDGYFTVYK